MTDRPCPVCRAPIERIEIPLNPRGGERDAWAVPCGHLLEMALARRAYEDGNPRVDWEAATGVAYIAGERNRQRTEEGHDPAGDAAHTGAELAWAAWAYVDVAAAGTWDPGEPPTPWPWAAEDWRPGPTRIRNLTKAGALIAAEIDRLLADGEQP